jgi:hypothetical protein
MFRRLRAGDNARLFLGSNASVADGVPDSSSSTPGASDSTSEMHPLLELMETFEDPGRQYDWVEMSNGLQLAVPNGSTFELAVAALFASMGHLYRPYEPEQANELLKSLLEKGSQLPEPLLCEICAISCIGCRFSQSAIPAELGELFYVSGRNLLEIIIEDNPLPAMKVCSLLAIYRVVNKPVITVGLLGSDYPTKNRKRY